MRRLLSKSQFCKNTILKGIFVNKMIEKSYSIIKSIAMLFKWKIIYIFRWKWGKLGILGHIDDFSPKYSRIIHYSYNYANSNFHWRNYCRVAQKSRLYKKKLLNYWLLYINRRALTRCTKICKQKIIWFSFAKDIDQKPIWPLNIL